MAIIALSDHMDAIKFQECPFFSGKPFGKDNLWKNWRKSICCATGTIQKGDGLPIPDPSPEGYYASSWKWLKESHILPRKMNLLACKPIDPSTQRLHWKKICSAPIRYRTAGPALMKEARTPTFYSCSVTSSRSRYLSVIHPDNMLRPPPPPSW